MTDEKTAKNAINYSCEMCDFKCCKKSNYTSHMLTAKHIKITNASQNTAENASIYKCICGNEYKHRQSLHKHKQICSDIADANYKNKIIEDLLKQNNELKEIILEQKEVFIEQIEYNKQLLEIAKEQKELTQEQKYIAKDQAEEQHEHNKKILELAQEQKYLVQDQVEEQQEHNKKILELAQEQKEITMEQSEQTKQLMEQIKEKGLGNTIINNNNTTNNTFNLNNFLNVTCKDAMDISELIEYIDKYTVSNKLIEYFEHGSHAASMSNVLEAIFDEIPVNKRPIHCSDLKREIMHVKDNEIWEKEDDNGPRTQENLIVTYVKGRVFNEILRWKKDVLKPKTENDDNKYDRIVTHLFGAVGNKEAVEKDDQKIKTNMAKKIFISKTIV